MLAKTKTIMQRLLDGPVHTEELNRLRRENAEFKRVCALQSVIIATRTQHEGMNERVS